MSDRGCSTPTIAGPCSWMGVGGPGCGYFLQKRPAFILAQLPRTTELGRIFGSDIST